MTTPGRELIKAPPSQWGQLHRQRWPSDREAFQAAIGRLLSRALTGERIVTWPATEPGKPVTVRLLGVPDADCEALACLAPPSVRDDGTTPNKSLDLRSVLLGWAPRSDGTWTMNQFPGSVYSQLVNVDAMVCALVLVPVMGELAGILTLRAGEGGTTDKARGELLARCREAHEALGLVRDQIDPLLTPRSNASRSSTHGGNCWRDGDNTQRTSARVRSPSYASGLRKRTTERPARTGRSSGHA
jgi:hypothetical protein